MKKTFFAVAAALIAFAATAQENMKDAEGLRYWRQTHQMRDASKLHLQQSHRKLADVPNTQQPARKSTFAMPEGRVWFPGEWEEVQAIVVTPYYMYYVPEHPNWYVDPQVTGYADYYSNYYSQTPSGGGPYKSMMDTTNASGIGDVSFYLMDAIQLGGAQAWVRVEEADDTMAVKRKLERMGLRNNNMRFIIAPGNSFWYRDCGPICFYYGDDDQVGMLDFEYYPGRALDDSLPVYIERQIGLPNFTTSIEWEGGNCLVDGAGMVFSSDQIYSGNADMYGQLTWDGVDPNTINYSRKERMTGAQVKQGLHDLLGQRQTIILPAYKYDGGTGHVDLYADMLDENRFVFSIMPSQYSAWVDYTTGQRNIDSLCSYRSIFDANYTYNTIPFPSKDDGSNFSGQSDYTNYTRTYSNHTFVNNVIIQPCFSTVGSDGMPTAEWDRANIEEVKKAYPGYTIYCVNVGGGFDGSGGAIHCITKQIPAENPIRILHHEIYGNANGMSGQQMPVSAIVTNHDGISHAEVKYRIDGGSWQTIDLTANGNRYYGKFPTMSSPASAYDTVYVNDTTVASIDAVVASVDTITTIDSTMTIDGVDTTYTYDTTTVYDTIFAYDTTYAYSVDTIVQEIVNTTNVEYYISATSTNGKTITKPMTASQGGYYSFYYTSMQDANAELDSSRYDFSTEPMPSDQITFSMKNVTLGIADVNRESDDSRFGQFYPNPATERADMQIDMADGESYTVMVYDLNGRAVHTSSLQAGGEIVYSINTSRMASGMYTVVFRSGSQQVVRKLIVK